MVRVVADGYMWFGFGPYKSSFLPRTRESSLPFRETLSWPLVRPTTMVGVALGWMTAGLTTSALPCIEPPPRLQAQDSRALADLARPLVLKHGFVLLEGLDEMSAAEMVDLVRAIAGPNHEMLRFDSGMYGDNCVPGVPEVRVLGRGHERALLTDIGYEWHQDGGGSAPFITMLHCKEPAEGADTLFADGAVLFARLSAADQQHARSWSAVYSNEFTAGGPTALDAAYGVRVSACGTRRLRAASRRKTGWTLSRFRRSLVTVARDGVERLLAGGKALECLETIAPDTAHASVGAQGTPPEEEPIAQVLSAEASAAELSRLLRAALRPLEESPLDDDLRALGATRFDPEAVYVHAWQRGDALVFDNDRMLHSTVPLALYRPTDRRLMWQVICRCEESRVEDRFRVPVRPGATRELGARGAPVRV